MPNYDFEIIRKKIYQYCAYQERSENQVYEKLKSLGLKDELQIQSLIDELKSQKFIDDERYIKSFVRGKFRNCQWGKQKIAYELINQNFSAQIIENALSEIDEEEYLQTLSRLAIKKLQSLNGDQNAYTKTIRYLHQKGYELEYIEQVLKNIKNDRSY